MSMSSEAATSASRTPPWLASGAKASFLSLAQFTSGHKMRSISVNTALHCFPCTNIASIASRAVYLLETTFEASFESHSLADVKPLNRLLKN
jgi:hypothetical protein